MDGWTEKSRKKGRERGMDGWMAEMVSSYLKATYLASMHSIQHLFSYDYIYLLFDSNLTK